MTYATILSSYEIPSTSYVKAVQFLNSNNALREVEYIERIREMCGEDCFTKVTVSDSIPLRLVYLYCVQNSIKNPEIDGLSLLKTSYEEAFNFVSKNEWAVVREIDSEDNVITMSKTKNKKEKGKNELAEEYYAANRETQTRKEIITHFVEVIGLTKAGANTYFYNCAKTFGPIKEATKVEKTKKVSKYARAVELYTSNPNLTKEQYIELFMTELNTSKAGATTYFYNSKKQVAG